MTSRHANHTDAWERMYEKREREKSGLQVQDPKETLRKMYEQLVTPKLARRGANVPLPTEGDEDAQQDEAAKHKGKVKKKDKKDKKKEKKNQKKQKKQKRKKKAKSSSSSTSSSESSSSVSESGAKSTAGAHSVTAEKDGDDLRLFLKEARRETLVLKERKRSELRVIEFTATDLDDFDRQFQATGVEQVDIDNLAIEDSDGRSIMVTSLGKLRRWPVRVRYAHEPEAKEGVEADANANEVVVLEQLPCAVAKTGPKAADEIIGIRSSSGDKEKEQQPTVVYGNPWERRRNKRRKQE